MDGDRADLKCLVEIKTRYGCYLYVDEAHAVGVLGPNGFGLAETENILPFVDILVGTFGKAFASEGAFLICGRSVRDYLINRMRPFIFTTALPPITVRWTQFILDQISGMKTERERLDRYARTIRNVLKRPGIQTIGDTHIIPIITGDHKRAEVLAARFQESGFYVLPIRRPTVPVGGERVRLSLSAALSEEDMEKLVRLCEHIG